MTTLIDKIASFDRAPITHRFDRRDILELVGSARTAPDGVLDIETGTFISMDAVGCAITQIISSRAVTIGEISDAVADRYGLTSGEALRRTLGYVNHLDNEALLICDTRGRSGGRVRTGSVLSARRFNVMPFTLDWLSFARGGRTRRVAPRLGALARVVVSTQWIVPAAGFLLSCFVVAATVFSLGLDQVSSSAQVQAIILAPIAVGLVHLALVWVHEAGHLLVARSLALRGTEPLFVVARGRKIGIVRRRGTWWAEVAVSIAGPVAAALTGLFFALMVATVLRGVVISIVGSDVVVGAATFLALAHLLSLVPFAADGHNIVRSLRHRATGVQDDEDLGTADVDELPAS